MIDGPVMMQTQWWADWYCKSTGATFHQLTAPETYLGYYHGSRLDKYGYYPKFSKLVRRVLPMIRWYCNAIGPNELEVLQKVPKGFVCPSPCKSVPAGWKSKRSGTIIVDLQGDWHFDKKRIRYALKRSRDVRVNVVEDYRPWVAAMYQKKKPFPYIDEYISVICKHGGFLLEARCGERLIAGLGVRVALGWAQEMWSWSTTEGYHTCAQDLLHVTAIDRCHELGYDVFDLANIDPNAVHGTKAYGIKRFKEKYGTYIERPLIWR